MVWSHGCEFRPHAAEIEVVVALERDVGLAEIRVFEQLGIDCGTAGEDLGELQAELRDVFDLVGRADQLGRVRKGLGAEVVLGMNVGGCEIERLGAGEFFRHLVYRRTVAWAQAGVDHEYGAIADDVADIGHQWDAVVGDNVDVGGDLAEPLDLDDRRRPRLRNERRGRPDECQCRDDNPQGRAHGSPFFLPGDFVRWPRERI